MKPVIPKEAAELRGSTQRALEATVRARGYAEQAKSHALELQIRLRNFRSHIDKAYRELFPDDPRI